MIFSLWVNSKCYGPDHAVRPWSRCLMIVTLPSSMAIPLVLCVVWLWWCCLNAIYQYVYFRKRCSHHKSLFHICSSRSVPSFTQTPCCLPSAVLENCLWSWIIHFAQLGVGLQMLFRLSFFAPSGRLLSQICFFAKKQCVSSVGRKKARAGCLNCNCDQDQVCRPFR